LEIKSHPGFGAERSDAGGIMFWSRWSTRKRILASLAALFLLSVVTTAPFLFWQLHEASSSLHSFGDALAAKDYQKAYELTDPGFQEFSSFEAFLNAHEGLTTRFGNLKSLSWSTLNVKKQESYWYATADVDLQFERVMVPFTFVLKKSNQWRVYSYHEQ
jgi:hypothetical protein